MIFLLGIGCFVISCRPGSNQNPAPASLTFTNPYKDSYHVDNGSVSENLIGFRTSIKVLTTDQNRSPVHYSSSPYSYIRNIESPSTRGSHVGNPHIGGDVYVHNFQQPEGAAYIVSQIHIHTRGGCGHPLPSRATSNQRGGEMVLHYVSDLLQYPAHISIFPGEWGLDFFLECN